MAQKVNFKEVSSMTICKDNTASSDQVIAHIKKSVTPMHDVQKLMLSILKQYQQVDKVGVALGVMDRSASFADSVSWCSIVGKLDHNKDTLDKVSKKQLSESVDYLENLMGSFNEKVVSQIQKYRDKWMRRVLLWDLFVVSLLSVFLLGALFLSGVNVSRDVLFEFVQQRPLFLLLSVITIVAASIQFHFFVRRKVIENMLEKNEDKLPPGMSLLKALIYNSRIQHSIFRPEPVGWTFLQKFRLKSITTKLKGLRLQMTDVLANYPDVESSKIIADKS